MVTRLLVLVEAWDEVERAEIRDRFRHGWAAICLLRLLLGRAGQRIERGDNLAATTSLGQGATGRELRLLLGRAGQRIERGDNLAATTSLGQGASESRGLETEHPAL